VRDDIEYVDESKAASARPASEITVVNHLTDTLIREVKNLPKLINEQKQFPRSASKITSQVFSE
jgi:hypothetical protein